MMIVAPGRGGGGLQTSESTACDVLYIDGPVRTALRSLPPGLQDHVRGELRRKLKKLAKDGKLAAHRFGKERGLLAYIDSRRPQEAAVTAVAAAATEAAPGHER